MTCRLSYPVIALIALLASCSRPAVSDCFLFAEDCQIAGRYIYDLDLSDSLALYDIHLYTRIDKFPEDLAMMEDLPLRIRWEAPSGERYEETVYFPVRDKVMALYRSELAPKEWGMWKIEINTRTDIPEMKGLGLVLERKDTADGSR